MKQGQGGSAGARSGVMRQWSRLSPAEQLALREDFGRYQDSLPPTCSMDAKIERFRAWLAEHDVDFDAI